MIAVIILLLVASFVAAGVGIWHIFPTYARSRSKQSDVETSEEFSSEAASSAVPGPRGPSPHIPPPGWSSHPIVPPGGPDQPPPRACKSIGPRIMIRRC